MTGATDIAAAEPLRPAIGPWRETWLSFRENKGAVAASVVIAIVALVAIFADWVAPYSPIAQDRDAFLAPPIWAQGGSAKFLLGTDDVGRDMLSRLIHGARYSLLIGCIVITISLSLGVLLGLAAGYVRGLTEELIMRLMDIMLAIPALLLAIVIVAILGPSLTNAVIAVAITYLPHFTRMVRATVIAEMTKDYVTAARVSGAGCAAATT